MEMRGKQINEPSRTRASGGMQFASISASLDTDAQSDGMQR